MNEAIRGLRAAIASNVAASRAISREIGESSGPGRAAARLRKRRLGAGTRVLLLALALRRGAPYARVESPRTASRPDAADVADAAGVGRAEASAWLSPAAAREAA